MDRRYTLRHWFDFVDVVDRQTNAAASRARATVSDCHAARGTQRIRGSFNSAVVRSRRKRDSRRRSHTDVR